MLNILSFRFIIRSKRNKNVGIEKELRGAWAPPKSALRIKRKFKQTHIYQAKQVDLAIQQIIVPSRAIHDLITPMQSKRTIVIGDIHGCYHEFLELLDICQYNKTQDELILVGDLVNKGPMSWEVLNHIRDNEIKTVLGNHELKLIKILKDKTAFEPLSQIWEQLLEKIQGQEKDWLKWLEGIPKYIETEDYLVVHGGLAPGQKPEDTPPELLANIRTWDDKGKDLKNPKNPAWHDLYKDEKLVVYGHWAIQGFLSKENSVCLDSGCVYGKDLSALILPEREIIRVKARRAYVSIK